MRNSIADATRALLAAVPLALTLAAASSTAFGQADLKPPKPTVLPSPAAAEPGTEPVTPAAGTPQLTPADVTAWLDGFMPNAIKEGDIAGAVVLVVKDGVVVAERGYGYSDVAKGAPMEPDRTLVRPGSISKLFTWTAVMQLVEQGKIDLDADVNQYLDFKIPDYQGKPVTMRNIMTHTAGFEETLRWLIMKEDEAIPSYSAILKERVPERIFAPGTTPAYSNYACSLAGYVVERVSGMPFNDYVVRHIFAPLGMGSTTFQQPLPEDWKPRMSKGYRYGSQEPQTFELVGPAPAGSVSTTASDMGRFMIAHLQDGRYGDARILQPETARQMHGTALDLLPSVNRMLLGFYESNYKGHRMIAHGGDTGWFHSDMNLFLDQGAGLFVSFNSAGKEGAAHPLRANLLQQFADRYFPVPDAPVAAVDEKTAREHAAMIAGQYISSRRVESTFMSLLNLASTIKVVPNDDGTISVSMFRSPAGELLRWREIRPFVWQQQHDPQLLVGEVRDGRVERFANAYYAPIMVFERPAAAKSGTWLLPAAVVALVALLLTALAWPVAALARRHYRLRYPLIGAEARAQKTLRTVSVLTVLVWAAWLGLIAAMMSNFSLLSSRTDLWLLALQVIGIVVFVLGTIVGLWAAWKVVRGRRSGWAKLWAIVLALSLVVSLWVAASFHLLAVGTGY